jgi:hypothetical protein
MSYGPNFSQIDINFKKRYKYYHTLTITEGFIGTMSKLDKEQVIEQFTQAYQAANGKAPEIEAKSGWFSVDGGKNVRLATLVEMTAELSGDNTPAPAATTSVETKPAKKKAAPKPAAPKAKKAAKSKGFSVKAFWEEHVISKQNASRPPR